MKRLRGGLNRSFSIGEIRPPLPLLPEVAFKGSLCMGMLFYISYNMRINVASHKGGEEELEVCSP